MNVVLITSAGVEIKYSHWNAITLDCDLFWGPTYALAFARSLSSVENLLDEVWAEGGAVIDYTSRRLVLFGGEDIRSDVPLRRIYLKMLAATWPEWDVAWMRDDVVTLANAAGVNRDEVIDNADRDWAHDVEDPEDDQWTDTIISVANVRGFSVHAVSMWASVFSSRILKSLPKLKRRHRYAFSAFPTGGIHIDEAARQLNVWSAACSVDAAARLQEAWPEWSLRYLHDSYEWHLEIVGDHVQVPLRTPAEYVEQLRAMLLGRPQRNMAESMQSLIETLNRAGEEVTAVNPEALKSVEVRPTPADAQRIFDKAAAAVLG